MKKIELILSVTVGLLTVIALSPGSWASVYETEPSDYDTMSVGAPSFIPGATAAASAGEEASGDQGSPITSNVPTSGDTVGQPTANPGSNVPTGGGNQPDIPEAAQSTTQWTTGDVQLYTGNGYNLQPTGITLKKDTQVTVAGDTSVAITTGTGSPIGVGIDNVTPISSYWAPGASQPSNGSYYIATPLLSGSGVTKENPFTKGKK